MMYPEYIAIKENGKILKGKLEPFISRKHKREVIDWLLNDEGAVYGYIYDYKKVERNTYKTIKSCFGDKQYKEFFKEIVN